MIITKDNYSEILSRIRSYTNKYYMFNNHKFYVNGTKYKIGFKSPSRFIYAQLHPYIIDPGSYRFADLIGARDILPFFYLDSDVIGKCAKTAKMGDMINFFPWGFKISIIYWPGIPPRAFSTLYFIINPFKRVKNLDYEIQKHKKEWKEE